MNKNILGLSLIILAICGVVAFAETNAPVPHAVSSAIGLSLGKHSAYLAESSFFEILRIIIFWFSPFLFLVGLLLVNFGTYKKLEKVLTKEIGIRKKIFPKLESNNYSFHEWLVGKNVLTGLILMCCALIFFFVLR